LANPAKDAFIDAATTQFQELKMAGAVQLHGEPPRKLANAPGREKPGKSGIIASAGPVFRSFREGLLGSSPQSGMRLCDGPPLDIRQNVGYIYV